MRPAPAFVPRLLATLHLTRPAHALTAVADTLAGIAVAWGFDPDGLAPGLWHLPLAAFLLYAGGLALNDVCDACQPRQAQAQARRPILCGQVSWRAAVLLAALLLAGGVFCAARYRPEAGHLALALAACIIAYDLHAKRRPWLGPLAMGLSRSGSLLLGMAANLGSLAQDWPLAVIPLAYVAAVTVIGRGEGDGRNPHGAATLGIFVLVAVAYGFLAVSRQQWHALIFVALFAAWAWPAFIQAAEAPTRESIRGAVKAGVLNLVVCDAALAAVFAGPLTALAILLLLPLSSGLSRVFPLI